MERALTFREQSSSDSRDVRDREARAVEVLFPGKDSALPRPGGSMEEPPFEANRLPFERVVRGCGKKSTAAFRSRGAHDRDPSFRRARASGAEGLVPPAIRTAKAEVQQIQMLFHPPFDGIEDRFEVGFERAVEDPNRVERRRPRVIPNGRGDGGSVPEKVLPGRVALDAAITTADPDAALDGDDLRVASVDAAVDDAHADGAQAHEAVTSERNNR